jgi:MFS-type transporter involved in bile tolerance (Atg22 family)
MTTKPSTTLTEVFMGLVITVLLTQTSIWLPLYLLHEHDIISNHIPWPLCALIALVWTITRFWWLNLRSSHDHLPTRGDDPRHVAR